MPFITPVLVKRMHWKIRPRQLASIAVIAGLALAIAACGSYGKSYPNSTFNNTTEFNTAIKSLWDKLLFWGTLVFVIVEGDSHLHDLSLPSAEQCGRAAARPRQHGARDRVDDRAGRHSRYSLRSQPSERSSRTQARAVPNALQVEVVGHQWWWEFRYPQYTTPHANRSRGHAGHCQRSVSPDRADRELHAANARTSCTRSGFRSSVASATSSRTTRTISGSRRTTSLTTTVFNGSCNEYCGASHANMRFRTFVVTPTRSSTGGCQHQLTPAAFALAPPAPPAPAPRIPRARGAAAARQTAATPAPVPVTPAVAVAAAASGLHVPHGVAAGLRVARYADARRAHVPGQHHRRRAARRANSLPAAPASGATPFAARSRRRPLVRTSRTSRTRSTIAAGIYPNDARHLGSGSRTRGS